jgi:hypothetical protein
MVNFFWILFSAFIQVDTTTTRVLNADNSRDIKD